MRRASVFDLFSIGVGPSSSHTTGPMRACAMVADELVASGAIDAAASVHVELLGALAATGRGHLTPEAVVAGLEGERPESVDPSSLTARLARITEDKVLALGGRHRVSFDPVVDLVFEPGRRLPRHPNALVVHVHDATGAPLLERTFFSIGGGAIEVHGEVAATIEDEPVLFGSGDELLALCASSGRSIAEVMLDEERRARGDVAISDGIQEIFSVMEGCIERGLVLEGTLPGGLAVARRAPSLRAQLETEEAEGRPPSPTEWVTLWALAASEENAAGGRVVTAPTNGACGIIPAVLHHWRRFTPGASLDDLPTFFLTAAAIGSLLTANASISGAEVGCQGEVGSACSMAAGGLAALLGGTPAQIENAAEIGIEHHLGLTCDPIGGLVQIPCIERNAIAASTAITAATMALRGTGEHKVSLDQAIETMYATGLDMASKYKETALGGLAVSVVEC
jgi:L-serine dehydratase